MKIAVSFQRLGLACTASTIFFVNPSKRSHLEEAGCPSTHPLGFTQETAGRLPLLMSAQRSVVSLRCAVRTLSSAMICVSYWNGLQMLQYWSLFVPTAPKLIWYLSPR